MFKLIRKKRSLGCNVTIVNVGFCIRRRIENRTRITAAEHERVLKQQPQEFYMKNHLRISRRLDLYNFIQVPHYSLDRLL